MALGEVSRWYLGIRRLGYPAVEAARRLRFLAQVSAGTYVSPPHSIKVRVLRSYLPRLRKPLFVETGTFLGDTVAAVKRFCGKVISIEIQPDLYSFAKRRFAQDVNVELICGDCVKELPLVLDRIREPAVFWLDGHHSGGITGRGLQPDPIVTSLQQIRRHSIDTHTLLIDDARCFASQNQPSFAEVVHELNAINPHYRISVHHDIIVATIGPPARPDHVND
jgi:hypothetical protein